MSSHGAENYGQYYWCAKVTKAVSPDGEIYAFADEVKTDASGAAVFLSTTKKSGESERVEREGGPVPLLMIPAGQWLAVYAASVIDEAAVAVEHWKGEIVEASR